MSNSKEDQVYKIFLNAIEQLKFSEAKNAMLIAFNAVSIYGMSQLYTNDYVKKSYFLSFWFSLSILIICIAIIFSLISFSPILKKVVSKPKPSTFSNILFFGYLKESNNIDLLNEIYGTAGVEEYTKFEKDLAEQIIQYSIITHRKYKFFHVAVWISITAYIMIILSVSIFFIQNVTK